jgi:hypothetical protein
VLKIKFRSVYVSLLLVVVPLPTSQAAPRIFKNCTELNKVFPGGVARTGATNSGGVAKKMPKYDTALYLANQKSDRDKDGIACEK